MAASISLRTMLLARRLPVPELDALRFGAFLLVFLHHALPHESAAYGWAPRAVAQGLAAAFAFVDHDLGPGYTELQPFWTTGTSALYHASKIVPMARIPDIIGHLEAFIDRWKDRSPRVRPMVGPSSLPRCSPMSKAWLSRTTSARSTWPSSP